MFISQTPLKDSLEIWDDLETLIDVTNTSDAHPILKVAGFHTMLGNIHPFMDGNGRMGRQLPNYMLMDADYPPIATKHDAGRQYGKSLEQWQIEGNPQPFIQIVTENINTEQENLIEILSNVRNA